MRILITGATGFLGGATAAALIADGRSETLRFLVRAADSEQALVRLRESLARFELTAVQLDCLRTDQIILGDIGAVSAFAGDPRIDTITHVLNCAAITSFGKHPKTWPINVEGTLAFAKRMSEVSGLQRFVHVGTAMACGPNKSSKFVSESWELPAISAHLVDYTASKAEAERRMREELPGLPLIVARPSIVVGHSRLGCTPSSSIFWVFRMGLGVEKWMCDIDSRVDVVPVDYCASALKLLLLKERLDHDLYHLSAGRQGACSFREIDVAVAVHKGEQPIAARYQKIGVDQVRALAPVFAEKLGITNRRLMAKAMALYGAFSELEYVFDNTRLMSAGLAPPPRFTDYIGRCFKTSEGMTLTEQMLNDFK
jgi:nucleoside-diphosphate-sugar epimerase